MKKLLYLILAFALMLALCTVPIWAEEVVPEDASQSALETDPPPEKNDVPFSTYVSNLLGEYAGEILSALSAVGALIIGILFKKGLLPVVSKALIGFGEKASDISEAAKNGLDTATSIAKNTATTIDDLQAKLEAFEKDSTDKLSTYGQIVALQADMIGSLMLNLRLSPDQRASVEKAMQAIKNKTAATEGGEGE